WAFADTPAGCNSGLLVNSSLPPRRQKALSAPGKRRSPVSASCRSRGNNCIAFFATGTTTGTLVISRHQQHLTDIPPILNEVVRLYDFGELERLGDLRFDDALRP